MLYAIPFVILLLVLLVLKKRESANKEVADKSTKASTRKSPKKTTARSSRSSHTRPTRSKVVQDNVVTQQTTTPLKEDFKQSIERLIQEKNYFSAEARINQALNQNNSQHELYLYLLDVHQAHKDDLAIDQLLNHIRSLGLTDIIAQAEEKQKAYEEQVITKSPIDTIDFKPASSPKKPEIPTLNTQSTAAFDALVTPSTSAEKNNFDAIQSEFKTTQNLQEVPVSSIEIAQPQVIAITPTPSKVEEPAQSLDFNLDTETQSSNDSEQVVIKKPETPKIQSIELHSSKAEIAEKSPEIQPLEFSFTPSTDAVTSTENTTVINTTSDDVPPLEFSFDFAPKTNETQPPQEVKTTDSSVENSLDFSFDLKILTNETLIENQSSTSNESESPSDQSEKVSPRQPILDFDFKTDLADTTEVKTPSITFDSSIAQSNVTTLSTETISDPLAQAFPELLSVDETQLNLDLATQYVEFGAYDSARQLLLDTQNLSAEQRQQSQNLLNRIAS